MLIKQLKTLLLISWLTYRRTRKRFTAPKPKRMGQAKINKSAAFWAKLARTEPNNAEMTLFGIMTYLELPYKYTGNGSFIFMGMAPDFVHKTKRKIIELYGERWHAPEEEQQRIDLFARSDYQTLIVWSKELRPRPRERKLLYKKLRDFEEL